MMMVMVMKNEKSGMMIKWNGVLNKDILILKMYYRIEKVKVFSFGLFFD